ncbi:unnamed protein product [Brassica oleracea var. botrytis]
MSSDIYSSSANASATRPPTNAYLMLRYEQPHRPLHLPRELARYLLRPENGSIIAINLDRLGLSGELKFSTLTGLTSLRNLTLSGNNFLGRVVPSLGAISSLQRLDLRDSGNLLAGNRTRLLCSSFVEGLLPCSYPELDQKLEEAERLKKKRDPRLDFKEKQAEHLYRQ